MYKNDQVNLFINNQNGEHQRNPRKEPDSDRQRTGIGLDVIVVRGRASSR